MILGGRSCSDLLSGASIGMVKPDDEGPSWPRPLRMGHICKYRPRYHLMYDPQCYEILLTGKQSSARGPSFSTFSTKSSPRRDNSLSLGCGLLNEKGETGGKFRVKPSNISVKYTKY